MSLALYQNYGISFNCSAEANPSVTSYLPIWERHCYLGHEHFRNMEQKRVNKGMFIYKCVANNTYGTGISENIVVHVYGKWLFSEFYS